MRRIRPPETRYLDALGQLVAGPQQGCLDTILISVEAAGDLRRMRPDPNGPPLMELVDIRGVANLEDLLRWLWPEVVTHMEPQ